MKRKQKGKLLLIGLIAVVCMGIGYAAITSINLLVSGSASAKANGEMVVRFVRNTATETAIENPEENAILMSGKLADGTDMSASNLTATVDTDTTASFNVGELEEIGSYAEFTYTVVNESDGVDASLSFDVETTNDSEEYFNITKTVDKPIIGENETAKVKVKIELINTPKVDDVEGAFTVTLTATPEEQDLNAPAAGETTKEVASKADFLRAVKNANIETIVLEDDVTLGNTNLSISDDTTIDFNGNTLDVKPGTLKVTDGSELVLEDDNGTGGITSTYNAITVEDGSSLVVNGGTYETTTYTSRGSVITIPQDADNAKITINGGTINGEYFAVTVFGDSELEINGGEMISTATVKNKDQNGTTYHAYSVRLSDGNLTMNGGKIQGYHGGLGLIGTATATINDGEIYVSESYVGAKDSYYCLYLEGNGSVEVKNGIFTNNGTNPLVYSSSTGLANLRGGTWTAKSANAFNGTATGKANIKVYGGTYKKNTNGTLTDYNVDAYRQS